MLMQSDVRDIYHGIKMITFHPMRQSEKKTTGPQSNKGSTFENMEIYDNGLVTEFNLQLSENTESDRLTEIVLKYLRKNSYKIGNTELTTFPVSAGSPASLLNVTDFDECQNLNDNDCSKNANCFNLKGTYTCSCRENFADISEMHSIYPGRRCTNEKIGCASCHFNGRCALDTSCECFRWYFGPACQYNLKVILYGTVLIFIIILVFLFLLFFCILMKRNRHGNQRRNFEQHLIQGMVVKPALSVNEFQRRSVHDDQDEVSSNSTSSTAASQQQLRTSKANAAALSKSQYEKRRNPVFYYPQNTSKSNKSNKSARGSMERKSLQEPITVMIPRAKFQSQTDLSKKDNAPGNSNSNANKNNQTNNKKTAIPDKNSVTSMSCYSSQIEAKLLSYLDNSAPVPERKKSDQKKVS